MPELIFLFLQMFILHNDNMENYMQESLPKHLLNFC